MGRTLRILAIAIALTTAASCAPESTDVPSEPTGPLEGAWHRPSCDDATVVGILEEIYPGGFLEFSARVHCAHVFEMASRTDAWGARAAFGFVRKVLDDYEDDRLIDPSTGTLEEAITALFDALYAAIGMDPPGIVPGADMVAQEVTDGGGTVTTPSGHAAIRFLKEDLGDDVFVVISQIPDPDPGTPGGCPFGFPVPYDCYPLFYSYTVIPASAVVGTPILGQCVVEPPDPDAPPNATVESRLRIASEDPSNPGTLALWPLATAPSTVDCSDLAYGPSDWRDTFWAALGPAQGLFRVTPAYANPGRLGASVSTFSPFAPVDPESGQIDVTVQDANSTPLSGATVTLMDEFEDPIATLVTDTTGMVSFDGLPFDDYLLDVDLSGWEATSSIPGVTLSPTNPTESVTIEMAPVIS